MGQVFISYRRNDQPGSAGRLFDRLEAKIDDQVFMDIDGIAGGHDFVKVIDDRVELCDVVLAVIGDRWLSETDATTGKRRIELEDDFVRRELVAGLRVPNRVIPILLDNIPPLRKHDLPDELVKLADAHALRLRHESFDGDAERIIAAVQAAVKKSRPWDRVRFMAALNDAKGAGATDKFTRILDWADKRGLGLRWGNGVNMGTFVLQSKAKGRPVFYGQTDGMGFLYMPGLEKAGILPTEAHKKAAIDKLNQLRPLAINPDRATKTYVGFQIQALETGEIPDLLKILGDVFDGNVGIAPDANGAE